MQYQPIPLRLLQKVVDPYNRESHVLGNLWEVATELALKELDICYLDLSDRYQIGNTPDYETSESFIECKNWVGSVKGSYRVTLQKYYTQILPRFKHAEGRWKFKHKILILPLGAKWVQSALVAAKRDKVHIVFVPALVETISGLILAVDCIVNSLKELMHRERIILGFKKRFKSNFLYGCHDKQGKSGRNIDSFNDLRNIETLYTNVSNTIYPISYIPILDIDSSLFMPSMVINPSNMFGGVFEYG